MTDRATKLAARLAAAAAEQRRRQEEAVDEAERTRVPDRIRPTRQTEQRLQPDPILRLHKDGKLSDVERDAALDIRLAYYDTAAVVMAKSARWGSGGRSTGTFGGVERETHAQIARRQRYRFWAEEMRGPHRVAFIVAIDVAVEGLSPSTVDRDRRWANGTARDLLVSALRRYADLAGWGRMEAG